MKYVLFAAGLLALSSNTVFARTCPSFSASTMNVAGQTAATWRTDYPGDRPNPDIREPWESIDFTKSPAEYMTAVLERARPSFALTDRKLTGTSNADWWISEWMDYGTSGREPLMGLTKERGPNPGDLSRTNRDGSQVWAVGFYNKAGATVFGDIFAEPCNPSFPVALKFPFDTVSIKFLFTDAPPADVTYLKDAPEYDALIDAEGAGSSRRPVKDRAKRTVRLLQVDIAIKDTRARETDWVFGTFVWIGPPKGDRLFDNLVPTALQWGNDPGVYDTALRQSWVNPDLRNVTYGWEQRRTMGFLGRANGPADNIRSSCLSCHAAARTPRASIGILDSGFDMSIIDAAARTKTHVDTWFQNLEGGTLFRPFEPAASTLDYSLQLDSAVDRLCRACSAGDLKGTTPTICRTTGAFNRPVCNAPVSAERKLMLEAVVPPRQ